MYIYIYILLCPSRVFWKNDPATLKEGLKLLLTYGTGHGFCYEISKGFILPLAFNHSGRVTIVRSVWWGYRPLADCPGVLFLAECSHAFVTSLKINLFSSNLFIMDFHSPQVLLPRFPKAFTGKQISEMNVGRIRIIPQVHQTYLLRTKNTKFVFHSIFWPYYMVNFFIFTIMAAFLAYGKLK